MDRVEGGLGRAGLGSKHVPLGADGTLIPMTGVIGDNGIFQVTAQPLLGSSQISTESSFLAMDTTITYDTIICLCVKCSTRSNNERVLH